MTAKIGIIGAGAWGTSLAATVAGKNSDVLIWAFEKETANNINLRHENPDFLPGIAIPPAVTATGDITRLADRDFILLVAPCQHVRSIIAPLCDYAGTMVICCKGIEVATGKLVSDVIAEVMPNAAAAVLAGPQFAKEVALKLPTATTLACKDPERGAYLIENIASPYFRPYYSDDVIGVQLCGALKNVIAIGAGMVEGANLGENAKAALITRGMAEIVRLGKKMGARSETFLGLSGIGDLMLTANSRSSRNYSTGYALGQGQTIGEIMRDRKTVSEGVPTTKAAVALADRYGIDMPITYAINNIIDGKSDLKTTLKELMSRPFKKENC